MAKKYVRRDDGGVDLLTYHKRMSDAEFRDQKKETRAQIKAIEKELKNVEFAELPPGADELQTSAIDFFNFEIRNQNDALEQTLAGLNAELAEMDAV